jgi:16S rRNA C967 or C1407 C5-methylase (RsmB/RsmF family)
MRWVTVLILSSFNTVTKVQAIVYCTCSVSKEENEDVVEKALEYQSSGVKMQPYR